MAITKGDFSVAVNGDIREVAGTSLHQSVEMHRWLMDLLDDAAATNDDLVAVDSAIIPSRRITDNTIQLNAPYNIDQTVSERFYDGSFIQNDGDDVFSALVVKGSVASTTTILIIQDTNNDGSPTLVTNFWGDTSGAYADAANQILLQCLIKSRTAGVDLDGKRILLKAAELGDSYAEFPVTLTTSKETGALSTLTDTFNQTAAGTIATWTTVVNTEGYQGLDINGDGSNEFYFANVTKGSQTQAQTYEVAKYDQRRGSTETLYGLTGPLFRGITHEITVDTPTGTLVEPEKLTWTEATISSSGQLLATDSTTAATKVWIQLLTGIAPTDGTVLTGAGAGTVTVNVTVTTRPVNANCWMGNYTGAWLGAYGVAMLPADTVAADAFTALDNTSRNPPNNVSLVATGLVSGDIIFAAETKTDTDTVSGAHSLGDTTLTLTTGIDTSYDTVGRIIIDGVEHVFTNYTGTSVTIGGSGLKAALTGGETTSVTQIYNDRFTTTADAGSVNGVGDSIIEFTANVTSAFPTSGKARLWDGVDRYDEYSYTGVSGAQLTGVTPTLTQSYGSVVGYIPYASETASGTSISKTVVHSGDVSGRWRLYNSANNIVPFEVGFTITSGGSTTQLIRNADA